MGPRVVATALARVSAPAKREARASTPNLSSYSIQSATRNSVSNPNCMVLPCEQIELADQGCFQIGTYKRRTQPRRGHEKPMRAAFCMLISEIGGKKEKRTRKRGYHKPEPRRASLQRNSRLEEEERIWKPLVVNWRAAWTPPKKLSRSVGKTWILSRASAETSLAASPELFYPLPAESVDSGGKKP